MILITNLIGNNLKWLYFWNAHMFVCVCECVCMCLSVSILNKIPQRKYKFKKITFSFIDDLILLIVKIVLYDLHHILKINNLKSLNQKQSIRYLTISRNMRCLYVCVCVCVCMCVCMFVCVCVCVSVCCNHDQRTLAKIQNLKNNVFHN